MKKSLKIKNSFKDQNIFLFLLFGIILSIFNLINFNSIPIRLSISYILLFFIPGINLQLIINQKIKKTNFLLGIVLSYCYWILLGFFFQKLHIQFNIKSIFTGYYFILFLSLIIYLYRLFSAKIHLKNSITIKSIKNHLKLLKNKNYNYNFIFLVIFLFLIAIFCSFHFPIFPAEDDWYHLRICQAVIENNQLFLNQSYRGNLGYHFVKGFFSIISKVPLIIIAHNIGIFQFPLGCLLFYQLLNNQISNKNISILVTIAFSLSILGTVINLTQFWPTALTTIIGLEIYINFTFRMNFIQDYFSNDLKNISKKKNDKYNSNFKELRNTNISYYFLQLILILTMISTHVINTAIFLIPIIFCLIFSLLKNKLLMKDFIFYFGLLILQFLINPYSITWVFSLLKFRNPYVYLILLILIPILIISFVKFRKFVSKYTFQLNKQNNSKFSPENTSIKIEKNILWKFLIPIFLVLSPILFVFINSYTLYKLPVNLAITIPIIVITTLVIVLSIISFLIYREINLISKMNYIKIIIIITILSVLILIGTLISFINRVIELYSFIFYIGLGYYILFILQNRLKKKKNRKILLSIFLLVILSGSLYQINYKPFISDNEQNFINKTSNFMQNKSNNEDIMIFGTFKMKHIYNFYAIGNQNIYETNYIHLLWINNNSYLYFNQTINNSQFLNYESPNNITNFYFYFDESYLESGLILLDGKNYGIIPTTQFKLFYNANYVNRIAIGKEKRTIYCFI